MAFKNLLVHLDPSKSSLRRGEAAIALAAAHGAHLTALAAVPAPSLPSYVEAQIPESVLEQARQSLLADIGRIGDAFAARAKAEGIGFEVRKEVAREPLADVVARHARYADLVIMGQSDPDDPLTGEPELAEDVVLGGGRPVLMVPYIGALQPPGRKVVVAWDAGREAARAVADAMPMLEKAEQVLVLIVNPRRGPAAHGAEPGADIATHLARHGIKVDVKVYTQRDLSISDMLLSRIADEGADMVVLGAYGHARMRELVLGGVTRDMLRSMTVPLFMSH